MKKKIKKAFTLVELLVVIAILAILATVSIVGYNSFTKKAQVSNDTALVSQLNNLLKADSMLNGEAKTPTDVLKVTSEAGYDVEKLTPTASDYEIIWNQETNQFALLDEKGSVVYGEKNENADEYKNWKFVSEVKNDVNYSQYLKGTTFTGDLTVKAGIDVGNNTSVTTINYTNESDSKDVVIRTNGGNLTINDTNANNQQMHYGDSNKVEVTTGTSCYHEYGVVEVLIAKKGKVIVESGSKVSVAVSQTNATLETKENAVVENKQENVSENQINQLNNATAIVGINAYDSLEGAINVANDGDIVKLLKDTSLNETINISKAITIDGSNLTITGTGYTKYDDNRKKGIEVNSSDVIIKNLHLTDMPYYAAIGCVKDNTTIENVKIDKVGRMGIDVNGDGISASIKNCYVDLTYMCERTGNAINVQWGAIVNISNTSIVNVVELASEWASSGICVWDNSEVIVDNCILKNCKYAFAIDNYDNDNPTKLTISNTIVEGSSYAIKADNNHGNSFVLTLNNGNNFNVSETIARFFAYPEKENKLSSTVIINGGTYKANNGQNTSFAYVDQHDNWSNYLTGNITINGGTLSGSVANAFLGSDEEVITTRPAGIVIKDNR